MRECIVRKSVAMAFVVLALTGMPKTATPITFGFFSITANSVIDPSIGEAQLFVDVTDAGGGQVLFTFFNQGPAASSITDVYFDDGSLLGIAALIDADENGGDPGVNFSQGASPGNLPSGNTASPPFVATAGFLADSDPQVQPNGVNPGESLGILFDLQGTQTFNDVLAELGDGRLRIGIHVQGFADGESESFINNKTPIPEPSTLLLLGSGLISVAGIARFRCRKSCRKS